MAFYFPKLAIKIDWSRGYESLDTELARITRRSAIGKRVVDKLLKVFLVDGKEVWLLVHIEIQGYYDKKFAQRMFDYHNLIGYRYKRQVESMAILTDSNKNFKPSEYKDEGITYETSFKFSMVKLLDYKWADLEAFANPFALVTMAHLKAIELRGNKQAYQRLEWKLQLIHLLEARHLAKEIADVIFDFIDSIVQLPHDLEDVFFEEIERQENNMPYVNSIERIATRRGIAKGLEQGRQEGRQEGQQTLVLRQLRRRFGVLSPELEAQINQLGLTGLETLGDSLLDFNSVTDLVQWLQTSAKIS